MLLGAFVGFHAGFLIGWARHSFGMLGLHRLMALRGVRRSLWMLVGAVAGAAVGSLVRPDKWSRVAWPPPH
jgi:hypothetical protein